MGAIRSPCRQSLGTSRANVRLSPNIAEKVNATQSKPPENSRVCSALGSNAMLKMTMTSRAKTAEELNTSFVRNSTRRSFLRITAAVFQNGKPDAPPCRNSPRVNPYSSGDGEKLQMVYQG